MSRYKHPAIPEPTGDLTSVYGTVAAIKQAVEIMLGHRGTKVTSSVTFQDLIDMGIIGSDEIPK